MEIIRRILSAFLPGCVPAIRPFLALPSAARAPSRPAALVAAGNLALHEGDLAGADDAFGDAERVAQERGDLPGQALARTRMGVVALMKGEVVRARAKLEEGTLPAREADAPAVLLDGLAHVGNIAVAGGDLAAARLALAEARAVLPRFPVMGFRFNWLAGELALAEGDSRHAAREYASALSDRRTDGDSTGLAISVLGLAAVAADEGNGERAARLLGWSERVALGVGSQSFVEPGQRAKHAWIESAAREVLGKALFARLHAEGHTMTMEQGVAYALEHGARRAGARAAPRGGRSR